jgi:hypothetical protein
VIFYGLAIGILLGALSGGRIMRLADLHLRWGWVGLAAIGLQVVLFSTPIGQAMGWLAPVGYVASTAAVLGAVLVNIRTPGMSFIAGGAVSNLAAVVANGGYMPSTASALALAGRGDEAGYTNSVVVAHPVLAPFTDIFAIPTGVPLANVFSVGDVLIAAGVAVLVLAVMRSNDTRVAQGA